MHTSEVRTFLISAMHGKLSCKKIANDHQRVSHLNVSASFSKYANLYANLRSHIDSKLDVVLT